MGATAANPKDPSEVPAAGSTAQEGGAQEQPPASPARPAKDIAQPAPTSADTQARRERAAGARADAEVAPMIEAGTSDVSEDEFDPESWSDNGSSASTSISSSIYAHTYENGRRYHSYKHGRYPIPNDDIEQSREDMKHAMTLELTDGKLFYSPIGDHPQKILDIGTGTGIWAIEVGDQFPSAIVTGIDLSPIQPVWVPPNVKFVVDDCEDEWLNGDEFDLVHLRTMSCILKDVPKLIGQTLTNLKPGGWMEWQELHPYMRCDDGTMAPNDTAAQFYHLVHAVFEKMGMDMNKPPRLGELMEDAGFTNIHCIIKKVPVGTWAADKTLRLCGLYLKTAIQDVVPSLTARPFEIYGLTKEEREVWRATMLRSIEDLRAHRYWNVYFWYGQKPVN